jgi:hypothetical protein
MFFALPNRQQCCLDKSRSTTLASASRGVGVTRFVNRQTRSGVLQECGVRFGYSPDCRRYAFDRDRSPDTKPFLNALYQYPSSLKGL